MADNTEQEHLKSLANNHSENTPANISAPKEGETITQNQETQNMEVHHHAHREGRKNWKSYLWEFLMLFLAVFCGYLAEFQLEHTIEHQREKKFIRSIVEDLKSDIVSLNDLINVSENLINGTDSLLEELSNSHIYNNSNYAFKLWLNYSWSPDFMQNDRTIQQLKNSGGLRLIRNQKVSDSIMEYDQHMRFLYGQQIHVSEFLLSGKHYYYQLFPSIDLTLHPAVVSPLMTKDRKVVQEVYGYKLEYKENIKGLMDHYVWSKNAANRLVILIQKEYGLE